MLLLLPPSLSPFALTATFLQPPFSQSQLQYLIRSTSTSLLPLFSVFQSPLSFAFLRLPFLQVEPFALLQLLVSLTHLLLPFSLLPACVPLQLT